MDWIKRRSSSSSSSSADELAMAKAAAWAWYQHRSGRDGRTARESDLGRRSRTLLRRRPSRYRLEALSAAKGPGPGAGPGVSLLDVYEIERITRELERLIMAGGDGGERELERRREEASSAAAAAAAEGRRGPRKARGAWARHAVGICGVGGDAVEAATLAARRRGKAATVA